MMLVLVREEHEKQEIIRYLGDKFKTVPYLYVNTIKYGLGTDMVKTWIDRNEKGEICGIYLMYYDCIHFYTKEINDYPIERIINFIETYQPRVIILQGNVGDRCNEYFSENYFIERNHVIDMDPIEIEEKEYLSEIGTKKDVEQVVDLLIADPEFSNVYDRKILLKQMIDRYDNKFSRYFVIKDAGKVVAAYSTYGEVPGFAITNGVIVHPDYRRRGLASDVIKFACYTLAKENISRVSFVNYNNTKSLLLHEKLGAKKIATLAKYIKK